MGTLFERAPWGTVREDYSARRETLGSISVTSMPALVLITGAKTVCAGITVTASTVCFAVALWNGKDPILKERLFGLTGNEGNHGEDAKEYYFYSTGHLRTPT